MEWNGAPQKKIWKISKKWEVAIEFHFGKLTFFCMSSKYIKLSGQKDQVSIYTHVNFNDFAEILLTYNFWHQLQAIKNKQALESD